MRCPRRRAARRSSAAPAPSSASGQPEARERARRSISIAVMSKPRCSRAEPPRQALQHLVVRAAFARRLDQLGADLDVAVAAGLVEVVVLHEHRRGQHDIGQRAVSVMNCSCTQTNRSSRSEAAPHAVAIRGRPPPGWCSGSAARGPAGRRRARARSPVSTRADAAHVHLADAGVARVQALDQRLVPAIDAAVVPERAAALVPPGAGHGRQAASPRACWPRRCACARSRSRAGCKLRSRRAVERGEILDLPRPASPVIAAAHSGVRLARCASSAVRGSRRSAPCSRGRRSRRGRRRASRRRPARRRCRAAAPDACRPTAAVPVR